MNRQGASLNPWLFLPTDLTKLMQISAFSGRDACERTAEQTERIALLLSATSGSFNDTTAIRREHESNMKEWYHAAQLGWRIKGQKNISKAQG